MSNNLNQQLNDALNQYFNLGELRTLAFELNISYEDLAGEGKKQKILSLIEYAKRHKQLSELASYVQSARPFLTFDPSKSAIKEDVPQQIVDKTNPPTVQYNIDTVIGSAFGEGSQVTADQIAGRDIYVTPVGSRDDFLIELEKLQALLKQAAENKEFAEKRDAETAVEDIEDAIKETKQDSPRSSRISRRLEDVQEIVEESGKLIDKSRKAGSALLKALPIVINLLRFVQKVF